MKSNILLSICLFLFATFCIAQVDRNEVEKIVNEYQINLQSYFEFAQKKSVDNQIIAKDHLDQIFDDLNNADHTNDIAELNNNIAVDINLPEYLFEINSKSKDIKSLDFDKEVVIDDCEFNNNGMRFTIAKVYKKINNTSREISNEYALIIRTDRSPYQIESAVYYSQNLVSQKSQCSKDDQQGIQIDYKAIINSLANKAEFLFEQGDYLSSKEKFEEILAIEPGNLNAKEGIQDCLDTINAKNIAIEIQHAIDKKRYHRAIELVEKAEQSNLYISEADSIKQLCVESIKKVKITDLENTAEAYLAAQNSQKAISIYENLNKITGTSDYDSRIQKAKNSDPSFVKAEIQKAYEAAVKSKKNYLNTYRTYLKYENSNLLDGSNYYFMALMMLDKPNRVIKPMGYSRDRAFLLAKSYFFKSKELGYNVSYIENQIFTNKQAKRN